MPSISPVYSRKTEAETSNATNDSEHTPTSPSRSSDSSPSKNSSSSESPTFSERLKSARRLIPQHSGQTRLTRSTGDNDKIHEDESTKGVKSRTQRSEDFRTFFREHFILVEYKSVFKNPQGGVYVVPSLKSLQVWHGIVFLRAGPYRDGIFRFFIFLQDDFPDSRPLLKFTTPVFHPQIHPNGVLNLEVAFPQWQRGKNSVWQILRYMKNCFYNADTWGGINKMAVTTIHKSMEEFKEKARKCALESQRLFDEEAEVDSSVDDGNVLKVKQFTDTAFKNAKRMMLQGESPRYSPTNHLTS